MLCHDESLKTLKRYKLQIAFYEANKVIRPKITSGRPRSSQRWLPVNTGKSNMVPKETKSFLSSVPSNGTNPMASLEANTSVGAAKQASCEANNLVSTEAKYHRNMIRNCGVRYASCEAGNLV